jgi:hypothetical protein
MIMRKLTTLLLCSLLWLSYVHGSRDVLYIENQVLSSSESPDLSSLSDESKRLQSFSLTDPDGNPIANDDTFILHAPPSTEIMKAYIFITNNATVPKNLLVKKQELDVLPGTFNSFCWAGSCYPPFIFVSPDVLTVGPGQTTSGDDFYGEYSPENQIGITDIRYTFFDSENVNDSVSVIVRYKTINENIMKVHDATGLPGENITIELEILNDDPFVAFEVHFDLPEGFSYIAGSALLNPDRKADHIFNAAIHPSTGKLVMMAFSLTNANFTGNSGIVATFSLTTPETADEYPLIPENGVISDIQGNNLLTGYINGVINLTTGVQILPGDANCDGQVNVSDIVTTINFILGQNPQPFCFENADVNADGIINVSDVVGTVNIILGNL